MTPIRKHPVAALLVASMLLSACGGSGGSFNPFNWFRRAPQEETLAPSPETLQSAAFGLRVQQVLDLEIEPAPGGAIVRATGLTDTQGYFNAELVAQNDGQPSDGVLTYEFRAQAPYGFQAQSTQVSREIIAGHFVSEQSLSGVTSIRVLGQTNGLSSRR